MSTLSRIKTWISGDLLTANDLNGEFNNIINNYNGSINTSNIDLSISPTWTGFHTFSNSITFGATALKVSGAGAGVATITNANTATNRTLTLPDPGADSTLVALAGNQTLSGQKTFSGTANFDNNTLTIDGAGAGVATLVNANTANSRTITIPDPGASDTLVTLTSSGTLSNKTISAPVLSGTATGTYTLGGTPTLSGAAISGTTTVSGNTTFGSTNLKLAGAGAGVATLTNENTATSRTLTLPDPGADSTLVALAGAQTITGAKTFSTGTHIFSGADTLRIPTAAPATTSGNIGLSSGVLQIGDGTAARSYARLDNSQTFTGAKTFSGANTLIVPVTAPSAGTGSLAFVNGEVQVYTGSAVRHWVPVELSQPGVYNIFIGTGADSSQLKITGGSAALGATNPGYAVLRNYLDNSIVTYAVTSDVTIDLTGAHWGLDGKGNVTDAILRVYAIEDNGTLKWGVGYQGGFLYVSNAQDDTTATNINLPEEILVNSNVTTTGAYATEVGYVFADFTDASNEWAITSTYTSRSPDGIWQPWNKTYAGFSADPTSIDSEWMSIGKTVWVREYVGTAGTSNATTYTVTLPIKAMDVESHMSTYLSDNAVVLSAPGLIETTAASTTLNLYKTMPGGAWTGSSTKHARFTICYKAYQP